MTGRDFIGILYKVEPSPNPDLLKSRLFTKIHCYGKKIVSNLIGFLFLHKNLQLTNSRVVISNTTIVFQIAAQKYLHQAFLVPNSKIFIQANSRVLNSNMVIVFNFTAQKYLNKAFLVPNLFIFLFLDKTQHSDNVEGADFKYDNSFSKLQPKTHSNRSFLVPNLRLFIFARKFDDDSV